MIEQVAAMHEKFGIDLVPFGGLEEKQFRSVAMLEELTEYMAAPIGSADSLDALVDLIVFALGTADREGFSTNFNLAFARVMNANRAKEIGANQKRGSFQLDLVKPEGWTAPDLEDLV